MRKKDDKTRTISFFSQKNQQVIIVSSAMAKKYALDMEKDDSVIKYEANIPLTDFAVVVDGKGLRRKLLETEWISDFMVVKQDGTKIVEIVDEQKLENKRSCSERLELSRRYWKAAGAVDWQAVIVQKGETAW